MFSHLQHYPWKVPMTNSPFYDPIPPKIISYSPASRDNAIESIGAALDQYLLRGVQHNVPFVRDVLCNDDFVHTYEATHLLDYL